MTLSNLSPMAENRSDFDRHMMAIALHMASRGLGLAAPNPSVGAVIANEATGEVIARAVTAPGGRPHAEALAIDAAGVRARGMTIYVTLEPCSHHGQTGPCADAIISAGLKRAVVAIEDPDPRVAGRGLDRLRAAGIEVVRGVGAEAARWITRGHIVRVTERRPFITLKLALGSNGEIVRGLNGAPRWVTGAASRAAGHLLRAKSDAILVGAGTVRDDDPELTCRLPGMARRSPVRVVLSSVEAGSKLMQSARDVPLWVAMPANAVTHRADIEAAGGHIIETQTVGGMLWLPSLMEELVARGITRLLVEGGPTVWRAFADAALVDEVVVFVAGSADSVSPEPKHVLQMVEARLGPLPLAVTDMRRVGMDTMWHVRRSNTREG